MSQPLIIRILSASVAAANRAGELIREVLRRGNLGLVQKVYNNDAFLEGPKLNLPVGLR